MRRLALVAAVVLAGCGGATRVPTSRVASEVCEGQGRVVSVSASGGVYHVRCASDVIVLVAH